METKIFYQDVTIESINYYRKVWINGTYTNGGDGERLFPCNMDEADICIITRPISKSPKKEHKT